MSGRPSPEGTEALLAMLEVEEAQLAEVAEARAQEAALRRAAARLDKAEKDLCETTRVIGKMLEGMDCTSVGNWGFEGRMGWLLLEMRRLILKKLDAPRQAMAGQPTTGQPPQAAAGLPVPDSMRKD